MVDSDSFRLEDHIIPNFFSSEKAEEISHQMGLLKKKERERINNIILKALPHMKNEDNSIQSGSTMRARKQSLNNGSLFRMFISDVFGMNMVLIYLDSKTETGILDTLVNLMYSKYIHQSFFYLPQLCVMFNYKAYTDSLESYILDRCINQMKFSVQVTWLLNSYSEDEDMKREIYDNLLMKIEETLVNGNRGNLTQYLQYANLNRKSRNSNESNEIYLSSLNKEIRMKYFYICLEFYQKLKVMCEELKNYPKSSRKEALKQYIDKFNTHLNQTRKEKSDLIQNNYLFYGIILPFNDSFSTYDNDNSLIVRMVPEQSFCFSTKARVPTKICVECVKVEECEKWGDYYIEQKEENENKSEISSDSPIERISALSASMKIKVDDSKDKDNKDSKDNKECKDKDNNDSKDAKDSKDNKNSKDKKDNDKIQKLQDFFDEIKKTSILSDNNDIITIQEQKGNEFVVVEKQLSEEMKNVFGKPIEELSKEIKQTSPFRNFPTYKIKNFIAKADDDLRQELLAMQIIKQFEEIFKSANLPLKLHPYEILITSSSSGLLEFLSNTSSIDGIKKTMSNNNKSINIFYRKFFGQEFNEAQKNFVESLAGYSLVCYYMQLKDRHNGNILIDINGSIIHIDFGFILGISPGNLNFESAPFKLTKEYVELMDGEEGEMFKYFRELMIKGMIESRKHVESFVKIVEIMSHGAKMPCFDNKDIKVVIEKLRERFCEAKNDNEFPKIVDELIYKAKDNFWTNKYDYFQKVTNGIVP